MLTNQDRRRILNQVRSSESQDIIAALRGQVSPAPEQSAMSTPEPVSIPQSPQPIDVDFPESPSLPSNLVDSTTSEPTQLAKNGGFIEFITDPIRKRIAENLEPYSYEKPLKRLTDAVIFNKKNPDRLDADEARLGPMWWADRTDRFSATTERMDLLNMTMGQPQKYNSIAKAIYKPTKSKDPDAEYYRSIVTENKIKQLIKDDNLVPGYGYAGGVLGEFKIQEGEDEKGKYYSYYDKWDLNPLDHSIGSPKINKLVDKVTKAVGITPPEIYGRVYLNDLEEEQTVGNKVAQEREEYIRKKEEEDKAKFLETYGFTYEQYLADPSIADKKQKLGFRRFNKGGLRNHMMEYMNFSGRDTNNVNLVMNAIAEHESKNKVDEIQVSQKDDGTLFDGPGRGLFQFEIGPKKGANTALNRTANFLKNNTDKTIEDFTNIYDKYISSNSQDFSTFSKEDQEGIFIGDKIFGGVERRNKFNKVVKRDTPPTQEEVFMYWLNNHKGKVNGKSIKSLTKEEIDAERKKWNSRTKNIF
jgi:hypothetical protein